MFRIIPSIDLRAGKVVRLQQGDYARQLNYNLDPIQTTKDFAAAEARWMHVVDLDGAKAGTIAQLDLIGEIICAADIQVQVGGGVRSTQDVERLIELGAARVVIGTRAFEDWGWFESLVHEPRFARKITLAIDAKDGVIATKAWTESSGVRAIDVAKRVTAWPLAGLLYTDVAKDGMLSGPNVTQTAQLAQAGRVPVIASGGVASLEHIRELLPLGLWGVILGRSLHDERIKLSDAIELTKQ